MGMKNILLTLVTALVFMAVGYFVFTGLSGDGSSDDSSQETATETDVASEEAGNGSDAADDLSTGEDNMELENEDTILVIDDKEFNMDDIEFLTNLQLAQIDYFEEEDGDDWTEARRTQSSLNVQLQNLVELNIMYDLGEEKGFGFDTDQIDEEVKNFTDQFGDTEHFQEAEALAGDMFDEKFFTFTEQKMMIDRIVEELRKDYLSGFENAGEDEVNYEVSKEYELLVSDERDDHLIQTFLDEE